MKKSIVLFALSFTLLSCTKEDPILNETNAKPMDSLTQLNNSTSRVSRSNMPVYDRNKLIVQFAPGTTNAVKTNIRTAYQVVDFKLCEHCSDASIELWLFGNDIDIEPKKTAIEQGSGGGVEAIVDVDYEFTFSVDLTNPNLGTVSDNSYLPYIKPSNTGITIAVLDTGIAPSIGGVVSPVFETPFLYNATLDGNPSIYSGWDFVNHDPNCFDDNNGRHGSVVSSIITKVLNESLPTVPHQILPLKVCDALGKASYFNFLCATNYGLEHAKILQMSLGWYDDGFGDFVNTIFSNLITAYPEAIIITSAGNASNNNDILAHYPSGYPQDNIIAVAAANKNVNQATTFDFSNIASFSNYGIESVDFFAKGQNIPFLGYEMSGTSFAAPLVTAVVARKKYVNPSYSVNEIKAFLEYSGVSCPSSFDPVRKIKYNKIIFP